MQCASCLIDLTLVSNNSTSTAAYTYCTEVADMQNLWPLSTNIIQADSNVTRTSQVGRWGATPLQTQGPNNSHSALYERWQCSRLKAKHSHSVHQSPFPINHQPAKYATLTYDVGTRGLLSLGQTYRWQPLQPLFIGALLLATSAYNLKTSHWSTSVVLASNVDSWNPATEDTSNIHKKNFQNLKHAAAFCHRFPLEGMVMMLPLVAQQRIWQCFERV